MSPERNDSPKRHSARFCYAHDQFGRRDCICKNHVLMACGAVISLFEHGSRRPVSTVLDHALKAIILAVLVVAIGSAGAATAQTPGRGRSQPFAKAQPELSASRRVMAGSMVTVFVTKAPAEARIAIARPDDVPEKALVLVTPGAAAAAAITAPGEPGDYELRLLSRQGEMIEILLRQPLATMAATATLAAPERVKAGSSFPVRGIGPNGGRDRVGIARPDAGIDAIGASFFPAENVEAMLEAPDKPGSYELRYIMDAPVSGRKIIARRPLTVE